MHNDAARPVRQAAAGADITVGVRSMLDAALAYARQGTAVFPLYNPQPDGSCSCGNEGCGNKTGKHPRTISGLNAATTDVEHVQRWWTTWPDANIGIPTGAVNDLVIIDVDRAEGEASLRNLEKKYGPLPTTKKVITGNGYQLYYKHPGAKVKSKAPFCAEYPHVDSRGDGGYVVAPPSLHYSGARYVVVPTSSSALAELPAWLPELINGKQAHARQHSVAANDAIGEGSRNNTLTSKAGTMRRRGMTQDEIEAALHIANYQECSTPLPDDEVRGIARSIARYPPGTSDDVLRTLTEKANADRFAEQWGLDLRYVPELGKWFCWQGNRWEVDTVGAVMEMAKQTALNIYSEGDLVSDSDVRAKIAHHSKVSQQANKLEAMLKLAKTIPRLVVPTALLDADPWLLAVKNGTLDLRNGLLMESVRENYLTKLAPVTFDPSAKCPIFLKFIDQVMGGDQGLIGYLQRVVGYLLTGNTSEQCLFFLYGLGANGKSTLLNMIKALLGGELCRQIPSETIMFRPNKSGPTPELASLVGARAVMSTEVEDGTFMAESLVKLMTGDDPIPARHLYGHPFEYKPNFKLLFAGNHKPVIRGDDEGMWRRPHLIPFMITIPREDRDPHLPEKLRAELPGILNWALEGCRTWQASRLDPPAVIVDAVAEYRDEMDIVGQWIDECCNVEPSLYTTAKHSLFSFNLWLKNNGFRAWTSTAFGRKMTVRFRKDRNLHGTVYWGLTLKQPLYLPEGQGGRQVDGLGM